MERINVFAGRVSLYIFYGLLAYMPLHIFLSTWLGTSFGILGPAKVAKEFVMLFGAGLALFVAAKTGIVQQLIKNRLIQVISLFIGINIVLALLRATDQDAELLGLAYNTRFLIFFVWAVLLAGLFDAKRLLTNSVKIVLVVGGLVVMFGLAQYLFVPNDALTHVGYTRENGVLPAFFIDDKPDLERIMSSVRDPNSLGSYLIIIISLTVTLGLFTKDVRKKTLLGVASLVSFVALLWTFSRSALVGMVGSLVTSVAFVATLHTKLISKYKNPILIGFLGFFLALVAFGVMFRNSYVVQNVIFHADESTVLENPNELRARFWQESVEDIANNPVGYGPGTAGLASIRNDNKTVLNENYYLQSGYELGVVGLGLFVFILVSVGGKLFTLSRNQIPVAIALFASFIGLAITNFFVHIWANEAVAYTWWGLAGLALGADLFKKPKDRVS